MSRLTLVLAAFLSISSFAATPPAHLDQNYGKLPQSFGANQGQTDPQVKFTSRGQGYSLFLTNSAAVLSLSKTPFKSGCHPEQSEGPASNPHHPFQPCSAQQSPDTLRMSLAHSNPDALVEGTDPLPGKSNYFLGNDPAKWHTDIPTYAKVRYSQVYKGIDLVYYGNQRQLEYDFVVAPQANPNQIALKFDGATKLHLTRSGDLEVIAKSGQIAFHKPEIYQTKDGHHVPISGRFTLAANNSIAFQIGTYDHTQPLTIDPVLGYSTYLGGSTNDEANAIAVDASGHAYITGQTQSIDFPVTSGAYKTTNQNLGSGLAFITKLNPTGTALIYSTYLGSDGGVDGKSIAIDISGNAYITGPTTSLQFPVTSNAFQSTNNAGLGETAFVTKLNPTGSSLVYSTYLGGNYYDYSNAIAIDSLGNAYIIGATESPKFPVTIGAIQSKNVDGLGGTAFLTKLNPEGTGLVYSTLLGGIKASEGRSIAVDNSGNAYVTGHGAFPLASGVSNTKGGGVGVAEINPTGTGLVFSTFFGGTTFDQGNSIAIDSSGSAYITGYTLSSDFPVTQGAFMTTNKVGGDGVAFVAKLNPAGTDLVYSTYLGGSLGTGDRANSIVIDTSGNAFITGITKSLDFPVTSNAFQMVNNENAHYGTAFLTELNPTGSALIYSTFLGGSDYEVGNAIELDSFGNIYLAGSTASSDFPITSGVLQPTNKNVGGTNTAFITKFDPNSASTTTTITSSANPATTGSSIIFSATVKAASVTPSGTVTFIVDGQTVSTTTLSNSGIADYVTSALAAGSHTVTASYQGDVSLAPSESAPLLETILRPQVAAPTFSPAVGNYSLPQRVTLTDSTKGAVIYYTTDLTLPVTTVTQYTGAIPVNSTTTIKAFAIAPGYTNSIFVSGTYSIVVIRTAAPTFTPAPGIYHVAPTVSISDATPKATIYYTTDGTTPTTSSPRYLGATRITKSVTFKAIAIANGFSTSSVTSATYTVHFPPVVTTQSATAIQTTQANLNSSINGKNQTSKAWFVYGTSQTALTKQTAITQLPASLTNQIFAVPLTGLKSQTTYYYQAVAQTQGGTVSGSVLSFKTK